MIVFLVSSSMLADDEYPYLTFEDSSGSTTSMSVESLEITVSDGSLVVTNSEKSTSLSLTSLSKMYFTATDMTDTSVIEEINLTVDEPVEILSLTGISLGTYSSIETAHLALPYGIYIIKTTSGTHKMSIK